MSPKFRNVIGKSVGEMLAVAPVIAVLALVGCRQKQTDVTTAAADDSGPGAADVQGTDVNAAQTVRATNDVPAIAYGLAQTLQDSPFAAADPALKESYARALIAYDIGDYERALAELSDLRVGGELNQAQLKAVNELLGKTATAAPQLATNYAAAERSGVVQPEIFALTAENEPPFSTADPAVKETFARAKAAYDIGNYPAAVSELQSLVTNAQLNWQQKYAAQQLLSKTPQVVPGTQ